MFAADDLARLVIKKMEQHEETRQIAETVAHEFKNAGVAFADSSNNVCGDCTTTCVANDDFDCVDCSSDPNTYSDCDWWNPATWGKSPQKQVPKIPAACQNQGGTKANGDACNSACINMCLKKHPGASGSVCGEPQDSKCEALADESAPDGGGANIWNCWKSLC